MQIDNMAHTWKSFAEFVEYNKDIVFRVWKKGEEDVECDYLFFVGTISLDNDILVLAQTYDECSFDNKYPLISAIRLSEITFECFQSDQNIIEQTED